jgi:hypothetical protein
MPLISTDHSEWGPGAGDRAVVPGFVMTRAEVVDAGSPCRCIPFAARSEDRAQSRGSLIDSRPPGVMMDYISGADFSPDGTRLLLIAESPSETGYELLGRGQHSSEESTLGGAFEAETSSESKLPGVFVYVP